MPPEYAWACEECFAEIRDNSGVIITIWECPPDNMIPCQITPDGRIVACPDSWLVISEELIDASVVEEVVIVDIEI